MNHAAPAAGMDFQRLPRLFRVGAAAGRPERSGRAAFAAKGAEGAQKGLKKGVFASTVWVLSKNAVFAITLRF